MHLSLLLWVQINLSALGCKTGLHGDVASRCRTLLSPLFLYHVGIEAYDDSKRDPELASHRGWPGYLTLQLNHQQASTILAPAHSTSCLWIETNVKLIIG